MITAIFFGRWVVGFISNPYPVYFVEIWKWTCGFKTEIGLNYFQILRAIVDTLPTSEILSGKMRPNGFLFQKINDNQNIKTKNSGSRLKLPAK